MTTHGTEQGCAVVLGLSPTGLSVARSLAPRGVAVYGVDALWYEFGHFSRWVRHDKRISHLPPGPELLAGLLAFAADRDDRPVVFITSDAYIDFVAENRSDLEPCFTLADSMSPAVSTLYLNKRTFYQRCSALGVGMPVTFFPSTEADASAAVRELRYPAIVKPTHAYQVRKRLKGRKLIEVANPAEALAWWRTFAEWGTDSVLQELIPGAEANLAVAGLYMDRSRCCRSLLTARKTRQYPPNYGSASYIEARWLPDIAEMSVSLMQDLEYHGVCGTEYKWDARDGAWKLIEVNCRPVLWFSITKAAGVDVVWDAYCDLVGKPNPVHIGVQDDRVRWQLAVRDLVSAIHFMRSGELGVREFIRTVVDPRNKTEAVCSWSDWGANLAYPLNTAMQIWRNFVREPDPPHGRSPR